MCVWAEENLPRSEFINQTTATAQGKDFFFVCVCVMGVGWIVLLFFVLLQRERIKRKRKTGETEQTRRPQTKWATGRDRQRREHHAAAVHRNKNVSFYSMIEISTDATPEWKSRRAEKGIGQRWHMLPFPDVRVELFLSKGCFNVST